MFGQDRWSLPAAWFPAGSHPKADLNFLAKAYLSNGQKRRLGPGSLLIQQLKEIAYSLLHIIHIFSDARAPATVANSFLTVRKLLIAASEVGCSSLSEITPTNAKSIIELASGGRTRIELVTWLENLAELTRRGYITDGVQNYDFDIEIILPNKDTSVARGKQPLNDNERSLLLTNLLKVMDHQDDFICWTEDCLATPSANIHAREWLSTIFPKVAEKHYRFPDVLIHLYQATTGLLIGESLGPRPSELLSIEKGFIQRHGPDPLVSLDHFTLDTVTTKSIKKIGGLQRRLRIPELVYKAAVGLEEMHSMLGQQTPRDTVHAHARPEAALRPSGTMKICVDVNCEAWHGNGRMPALSGHDLLLQTLDQGFQSVETFDRPFLDRRRIDAFSAHRCREFVDVRPIQLGDMCRVAHRHLGTQSLQDEASAAAVIERVAEAREGDAQLFGHRENLDNVTQVRDCESVVTELRHLA